MSLSASTAIVFSLMAPALVFYFAFTSAARLNRQNQIEPLILAISLVIIGVCANILSIFLIDALPGRSSGMTAES